MTVPKLTKATARAVLEEVERPKEFLFNLRYPFNHRPEYCASRLLLSVSDEFIQMITTLKNGIDKKSKQQHKKISAECDMIAQEIVEQAQELEEGQAREMEQNIANYKRKNDELTEEKADIVKKLKVELEKFQLASGESIAMDKGGGQTSSSVATLKVGGSSEARDTDILDDPNRERTDTGNVSNVTPKNPPRRNKDNANKPKGKATTSRRKA
ncbi:hypothetical protein BC936DRAFT_149766 [Jimgerdemannia flammicorona]|uniref:Uncharacterized protein n=1 Tax=Jimgerdemannia flammicorona TaxID=994334 RepID=A0A433DJT4_9FUNG|nr:hypothetical protein BC936DRAFT_149766 [Jimgerdemannia flammicorona]